MKRLLWILLVVGCSSTEPRGIVGRWELESVNGQGLPAMILDVPDGCDVQVEGGHFEFEVNGSYTGSLEYSCSAEYIEGGTFTDNGGTLTLVDASGYTHTVTRSGDVLTHVSFGDRYVYHR